MSSDDKSAALVREVREGESRELKLLVAQGLLPLPPAELIPLQIFLAESEDAELAEASAASLTALDPRIVANAIAEDAEPAVLAFFAGRPSHPLVLETILRQRQVPPEILCEMARCVPPDVQEILLLRQDAIVANPEILDALAENPDLSTYASRRIGEYREHLLDRPRPAAPEPAREDESAEEASDAEVVAAVLDARAVEPEGEADESTGLSEAQIRSMPVPVRLKLTRGAPRTLRNMLIRDKNPMVAISVLTGNVISDSEAEQIANSRVVVEDVLSAISRNRQWIRKYTIAHALVKNPRTPVGIAIRLTHRLAVRDLKNLRRDHNVPEAVRSTAARLYRMKGV